MAGLKCSDYSPGMLKHRVAALTSDTGAVADGVGGYTNPTPEEAVFWANVGPLSGREQFFAQQLESVVSGRVVMRYSTTSAALTAKNILRFQSRLFNVRAIINVEEANRWLVCFYDEGAAV